MLVLIISAAQVLTLSVGQATPSASAVEVVKKAEAVAKREKKNVFVYFHASWCPWCKRMERLLADPVYGPKLQASYVIAEIDVRERGERQKDENAGWDKLMANLRGAAEQDVPYYAVLTPKGKKLGDSYRVVDVRIPSNAGYPQTEPEIKGFLDLLARTAPAFTSADLKNLGGYFRTGTNR